MILLDFDFPNQWLQSIVPLENTPYMIHNKELKSAKNNLFCNHPQVIIINWPYDMEMAYLGLTHIKWIRFNALRVQNVNKIKFSASMVASILLKVNQPISNTRPIPNT